MAKWFTGTVLSGDLACSINRSFRFFTHCCGGFPMMIYTCTAKYTREEMKEAEQVCLEVT